MVVSKKNGYLGNIKLAIVATHYDVYVTVESVQQVL